MSDRARIGALTSLVQSASTGGYTLPEDVVEAHNVWQRLRVQAERHAYDQALTVLRLAVEQAGNAAVAAASNATERIITDHLRPAHDELLEQAREVSAVLKPYTNAAFELDTHAIVTAPSKVRNAYVALPGLVERRRTLIIARDKANVIGYRDIEYDSGLFSTFQNPAAFRSDLPANTIMPPPIPADPTAALLWFASDDAAKGKPWFPTLKEQDAAWWAVFGEHVTRARQNQHNARAMAEQAVGLERRDGSGTAIPMPAHKAERQAALAGRLFGTLAGGVPVNGGSVKGE
jgi:hypothetical protein